MYEWTLVRALSSHWDSSNRGVRYARTVIWPTASPPRPPNERRASSLILHMRKLTSVGESPCCTRLTYQQPASMKCRYFVTPVNRSEDSPSCLTASLCKPFERLHLEPRGLLQRLQGLREACQNNRSFLRRAGRRGHPSQRLSVSTPI